MLPAAAMAPQYQPRRTPHGVVARIVRDQLPTLLAQADAGNVSVPAFVKGELEALTTCGDPAYGFTQLACQRCNHQRLLPFSCKCRTICSSCAGRRMSATTAFLIDNVIADIPVRHWTLTFPPPLRYLLAYETALCTRVLTIVIRAVFAWQRRRAKREFSLASVKDAYPAAVTAIHRVGSAINLNLHLHSVVTDGVFVRSTTGARPVFRTLPAPSKADIVALAWEVCTKTTRLLKRIGRAS